MERKAELFNYSPFDDVYIPYIAAPNPFRGMGRKMVWELLNAARLPYLTRWVIYQTLRNL